MNHKKSIIALVLAVIMTLAIFPLAAMAEDAENLPREETLYFAGEQWGSMINYNPLSNNSNAGFIFEQSDASTVFVYETLYMYNELNGELYPLLADGDYTLEDGVFTIKIKEAAHWNDGTPLTAHDVVYTYEINAELETAQAPAMDWIESIEATDDYTVVITADMENYNPYKIIEYFPRLYILPEHQISEMVERNDGDPVKIKEDYNDDIVSSGPYMKYFDDNSRVVVIRDDNYWGQDESMWGELPAPKYLAHMIFSDNNAGAVALQQGEVDVSQQFMPQIWKFWEEGLPISTYLDELPYYLGSSMPSILFNMNRPGLDQAVVRRAIAMSVDYEQVAEAAMSGYSDPIEPTLMNLSDPEQSLFNRDELEELFWVGKQVDEANALLDEAGIVDTDGDGIREFEGEPLVFTIQCPTGWTDWNATCEIVAAAGKSIGIDISTFFPEASVYTDNRMVGDFDLLMASYNGASAISPWIRIYSVLYSDHGENQDAENVFYNFGRYSNERVDELIDAIPTMEEDEQIEAYTELNRIYLEEVPTFPTMYRPVYFHTVNESVWTNYPEQGDGTDIPPGILSHGYAIAGLYEIELVNP